MAFRAWPPGAGARKQRLIIMFSPERHRPREFWPEQQGEEFTLKPILAPLEPFKKQTLILRGISNKVARTATATCAGWAVFSPASNCSREYSRRIGHARRWPAAFRSTRK